MRVTSNMMLSGYLKNLGNNMSELNKLQNKMATGKRITKPSDDPIGIISSMQTRVKIYKSDQYKRNVEKSLTWLEQTESSVLELNDMLKTAYEKAVYMSNDFLSPEDKIATAEMIEQLRDHVLTIGNAKSGDKYIFGGYNVTSPPFVVDDSGNILYNGIDLTDASNPALLSEDKASIQYEIGFDVVMDISTTGTQLFGMGDNNVYTVLDDFCNALRNDASAEEISQYIAKLQDCQTHVMSVDASVGGRVGRLELIQNRFEDDVLMYEAIKSNIEDVDQAEAIMNYKMSEFVYMAALQIGNNIVQTSLINFLK